MSDHTIKLTTRDNRTLTVNCSSDEDVVSAAQKENIFLSAQCQSGACGACIATHKQGDYHLGDYSTDALSADDIANKKVLLCRTFPDGDLTINLPYDYNASS